MYVHKALHMCEKWLAMVMSVHVEFFLRTSACLWRVPFSRIIVNDVQERGRVYEYVICAELCLVRNG